MEKILFNTDFSEVKESDDWKEYTKEIAEENSIEPDDFWEEQLFYEDQEIDLQCLKEDLSQNLGQKVIAIGRLGLWNSKPLFYAGFDENLNSIFKALGKCDQEKIYSDGLDIWYKGDHHDGTNYIIFRKLHSKITGEELEEIKDKIIGSQNITPEFLDSFSDSIYPDVAKVYGWEVRNLGEDEKTKILL